VNKLQRIGDLRIIMFLILLLLVLYSVVGSYQESLPDDYATLVTQAYQTRQPFLVPYNTILISPGSSQNLRAAVYGNYEHFNSYHLGLSCLDQVNSPYLAYFTFTHFPRYIHAEQGRVTVIDMTLAIPRNARPTTYLCRLELGNPVPAQGFAQARTSMLGTKEIYIVVMPQRL